MNLLHNSKAALHKAACLAVKVAHKVARKRPLLWPVWQTLPVAGLDVLHTQQVLYNLRRALPEGEEVWVFARCESTQPAAGALHRLLYRLCWSTLSMCISHAVCPVCC